MNTPTTLAGWLTYLETLHPKTIALGLERVRLVKERLNLNPSFPVVTVGGTNGKGSVCAMLEAMLDAAGYRVACYTSPHLLNYNERVKVGRKAVGDAELCAAFEKIEAVRGDVPLTYFEYGTLAAMQCFIDRKADVAILEVGLGGRLDAVNAFDSDCAVVTCVDIDHVEYLGDTREKIALEKAGIFRPGRVAVFGNLDMPHEIGVEAHRIGAHLWRQGYEFDFDAPGHLAEAERLYPRQWNYYAQGGGRRALPYPALRGSYQLDNASTALAVLDALNDRLPVGMDAVRRGLSGVALPGRFQRVPGVPELILDVAHNPHAAAALAQNLDDHMHVHTGVALPARTGHFQPARTLGVFSMLKDKDIAGVVRALKGRVDAWYVAGIDAPRGLKADELAQILRNEGVSGEVFVFSAIAEAFRQACDAARENDRIVAFGSFHTVAEVMRARGLRYA